MIKETNVCRTLCRVSRIKYKLGGNKTVKQTTALRGTKLGSHRASVPNLLGALSRRFWSKLLVSVSSSLKRE